jgi:hypothetical protein
MHCLSCRLIVTFVVALMLLENSCALLAYISTYSCDCQRTTRITGAVQKTQGNEDYTSFQEALPRKPEPHYIQCVLSLGCA